MAISFVKAVKGLLVMLFFIAAIFTVKHIYKINHKGPNCIRITFREGLNIHEVADLLQINGIVTKDKFFSSCDNEDLRNEFEFLKGESKTKYFALEGYLFPDTYDFLKDEDPLNVIRKFLINFRSKTENLKIPPEFTLEQILTIASILEAESNLEDGPMVSSVIHNRIKTFSNSGKNQFGEYGLDSLYLESTMYYPYRSKEECPPDFKSSYNTYEIKGFPPGPICSPGLKFINDAINPAETDYFYFCNDENKKIYFAKTYEEHCKNLKDIGLR